MRVLIIQRVASSGGGTFRGFALERVGHTLEWMAALTQ